MKRRVAMSRWARPLGMLLLSCLAAMSGCARDQQSATFFYEAVCPACEESRRMELLAGTVVGLERTVPNLSAEAFNLYEQGGMEALEEALASAGLESSTVSFPLLLVGDEVYEGEVAVRAEIDRLRGESR